MTGETTHLEIEAKYDVADGLDVPDLVGHGGVASVVVAPEMELTATYFDTADLALSAAGATLRRRTGGTDDGWHLKLPMATGERLEVQRALGRSASSPPAALTALVLAIVRTRPLQPVATLVTRRTVHQLVDRDGRVVAELADDTVTGERHDVPSPPVHWRELEIELVDGDRAALAALDQAARAAGAVPAAGPSKVGRVLTASRPSSSTDRGKGISRKTPAGDVLDASLRRDVLALVGTDPLLRLDRPGAAALMRSAVRRLRAGLALRRQVAPDALTTSLRSELAWLDESLAGLEAVDVTRQRIRDALAEEPKELVLGPVGRRSERELTAVRRKALADARETLGSARYLALLEDLFSLPERVPVAPVRAGDVMPDLAWRAVRRTERRLHELVRSPSGSDRRWQVTGTRRAVDRARYAEELAAAVTGSTAGSSAPALEKAAVVLADLDLCGRTQDALLELGLQANRAGENAFTFGRLHGLEALRAATLLARLPALRKEVKRLRTG